MVLYSLVFKLVNFVFMMWISGINCGSFKLVLVLLVNLLFGRVMGGGLL